MPGMNQAIRTFLSTAASLALILILRAGGRTGFGVAAVLAADSEAVTMRTILREYHTAASQHLQSLEADFNAHRPPGVAPVVYLDYDRIATWFGVGEGPSTVDQAIGDYLKAKTGRIYDAPALSLLAKAMNSLDAEGVVMQRDGAGSCLVVPQYPGVSFRTAYAASFRLGPYDALAGKTVAIDLSTKEFANFVNAHESWHCLDVRYMRDSGDGLAGAVKQNRAEMFADIGGVMEGIRNGADLTLIDKAAALHAGWAFLTGPAHAKMPGDSNEHFASIIYDTQDGLDALKIRIQQMGIANFRQLDRDQLRALDYEITDAHCLTYTQAQALQAYYATGQAPAVAAPWIARLAVVTAASVRDATPAELAARKQSAQDALGHLGATVARPSGSALSDGRVGDTAQTDQAAEPLLLQALKTRAAELGSATSFANQLKARQEMTDSLREKLLGDPSSERATEAQLQLLLYTDPHLIPRKNAIGRFAFADSAPN